MPERYSEAQKAEIRRGRKGRLDIDKGRAQIDENERLYQEALAKRGELQNRIGTLSNEIDVAKRTAGADDEAKATKAFQESPTGKAIDVGKVAGPIITGIGAGHIGARIGTGVIDSALGGRYENLKGIADDVRSNPINFDDPVSRGRGAGAVRAAQPFMPPRGARAIPEMTARGMVYGLPAAALAYEGLQLRGPAAEGARSPLERDLYRMGGTGMLAAGGGMAFEGGMRSVFGRTPPEIGRNVSAIHGVEEGLRNTEGRPPPPPPPPDAPALRTPSDRLISAAKAAGATGIRTKAQAVEYLNNNVTDANRAAVATELGVGPGQRIAGAVKRLASSRVASSVLLPLAAGALAYDAASNNAEAAGAEPGEARTQGIKEGAAATGGMAAGMYGLSKLPQAVRSAGGAGMSMLAPYTAADAYDPSPGELNRDRNDAARNLPSFLRAGGVESAYQMAQVPEPSPVRSVLTGHAAQLAGPLASANALQIPGDIPPNAARDAEAAASAAEGPSPARAAYGDQRFDAALQAFLGTIQEHNSSVQGAAQ